MCIRDSGNLALKSSEEKIIASIDVSNVGTKSGEEVVQLYIGLEQSRVDRPKKLLKGFKKVLLNPNQTQSISIEISKKDLSWYNPETKMWEIEDISYTVYMGSSSKEEDLLSAQIKL
jgi:beta-glucosidase